MNTCVSSFNDLDSSGKADFVKAWKHAKAKLVEAL
jgi:hypothetical protein